MKKLWLNNWYSYKNPYISIVGLKIWSRSDASEYFNITERLSRYAELKKNQIHN